MEPDTNIQTTPPTTQQIPIQAQTPEKRNSSIILWLLILAFIGIASHVGYQNWLLNKQIQTLKTRVISPTPSVTPTNSISEWLTYTNRTYGFEIKYPKPDPNDPSEKYNRYTDELFEINGLDFQVIQIKPINSPLSDPNAWWGQQKKDPEDMRVSSCYTAAITKHIVSRYKGILDDAIDPVITFNRNVVLLRQTSESPCNEPPSTQFIIAANNEGKLLSISEGYSAIGEKILSTFKFTQKRPLIPKCKSTNLNIGLTLPNNAWQCKVDNLGKEEVGWDGAISLTSPLFTIEVSSLGRGPYCGDGPDPENLCRESLYYKNDKFGLTTFTYKGEDKELFGEFLIGRKPWVSVKYTNMETQKLSDTQKQELFQLLSSASEIN